MKRVVTVSGDIVMEPRNLLVPIGTPFSDMVEAAGFRQNPYKVLSGGPMMGVAQFDLAVPVTKGTNAVTVLGEENRYMAAQPHCIRCGKCISVCPMHLMPLYLYSAERRGDLETLKRQNVLDCVECGSCAYTCPAACLWFTASAPPSRSCGTLRHPSRPLRRPNRKEGEPCRVKSSIFMS